MPERFPPTDVSELRLLAGELCLDFANTLDPRDGPSPVDLLSSLDDLARWAVRAGLLEERDARAIRAGSRSDPESAQSALADAVALRELIFRTFAAVARGAEPDAADLLELSERYPAALACFELRTAPGGLGWAARGEGDALERALAAIVRSAVELLTSPRRTRVKQCAAADECGWLFLDATRSGTRRWCRMSGCGSRAKARRYHARQTGTVRP